MIVFPSDSAFARFQLILNPIRDWNSVETESQGKGPRFQLILNPIRDWNPLPDDWKILKGKYVPINLKPY